MTKITGNYVFIFIWNCESREHLPYFINIQINGFKAKWVESSNVLNIALFYFVKFQKVSKINFRFRHKNWMIIETSPKMFSEDLNSDYLSIEALNDLFVCLHEELCSIEIVDFYCEKLLTLSCANDIINRPSISSSSPK